jgi:hypothetical protein
MNISGSWIMVLDLKRENGNQKTEAEVFNPWSFWIQFSTACGISVIPAKQTVS